MDRILLQKQVAYWFSPLTAASRRSTITTRAAPDDDHEISLRAKNNPSHESQSKLTRQRASQLTRPTCKGLDTSYLEASLCLVKNNLEGVIELIN